jgi:MFS family permease
MTWRLLANRQHRNVAVLSACQALLLANTSALVALSGLAGYALAADKSLATLPVTGWVAGGALTTMFASHLMQRVGRRQGFTVGALVGIGGALLCASALALHSFWLFCFGSMVFGAYNAFGQYYRFAAADAASPEFRARAISYVLAGGLIGGVIGPTTSRFTAHLLPTTYLAAYLTLIGFVVLVLALLRWLDIPPPTATDSSQPARPLSAIAAQPAFVVAVLAAALGYGVMNLLMTATPLAMGMCGHPYGAATSVISAHVIGMFAPSFVTGSLIRRLGLFTVMLCGVAINLVCIAIALGGVEVANFWWSLLLLGVGWNFLFIGATTLLTETYRASEKAKAQGVNDLAIFVTMAVSSLSSGMILQRDGWQTLNHAAIPFVLLIGAGVAWLALQRKGPPPVRAAEGDLEAPQDV